MTGRLSPEQRERYARHLVLPRVGPEGQEQLLNSSVLVVGAGGLGSPALMYLAAAGVGRIGIIDNDAVSASNLQRQVIHNSEWIGKSKIESASKWIAGLNPDVDVVKINDRLTDENSMEIWMIMMLLLMGRTISNLVILLGTLVKSLVSHGFSEVSIDSRVRSRHSTSMMDQIIVIYFQPPLLQNWHQIARKLAY